MYIEINVIMIPTIKQMTATGKLCFRILTALIMRSTPPIKNIHPNNSRQFVFGEPS